ncbi:hypothetical protein ACFX15_020673 [Malus domestica]|uniref:probable inactive poly [ADP-ribose] polymerase SRO2 n=1 Tax=Malus domestica TaxID=3750 RepID=UPI0004987FA8|nr:probable inactive poly [ADP-ribose] polymerase SRO2 [Malus domestica]
MSTDQFEFEDQISMTIDNDEEILDAGSDGGDSNDSVSGRFGVFTRSGMVRVDDESFEHEIIRKSFVLGMDLAGRDTNIVAVHKNLSSDPTRRARFESFKIFTQAVARKCGGNANVKYGWYGGSKEELCDVLVHGFSRCREPAPNEVSYGVGVHMIPAKFTCDGALSSVVDESGLKHILLCRVILGKAEMVAPGSKQSQPSSQEVDTGVDNLVNPRRYVVWSAIMNSHVYPCYLISFKAPSTLPNVVSGVPTMQRSALRPPPTSPWMSFPALLSILSKFLPPTKMQLLVVCHNKFRANKITRPQLIQRVRQIAGDRLLIGVIKSVKRQTDAGANA